MGIPKWESYGDSHVGILWEFPWESCGNPVGIPIWESHGNSHVGILWEFPQKTRGNGMGMGIGIPFPRQPCLLDYRKAFDHVDHTVLVTKCKTYNLPNFIIRWLCAFLSDRSQRVRLGQELSDWVNLKGSVPQGSWPGPLLFIVLTSST